LKTESTDMQERAQQLWRELDGLDWSSHEQAIVGILRDALEEVHNESRPTHGRSEVGQSPRASTATEGVDRVAENKVLIDSELLRKLIDVALSCALAHYGGEHSMDIPADERSAIDAAQKLLDKSDEAK